MKKFTKLLCAILVLSLLCGICAVSVSAAFTDDVSAGAWYEEAVRWCSNNGVMSGVSNSSFAPDSAMSRAMLATVLYRVAGSPAVEEDDVFSDVIPGAWYADAVAWISNKAFMSGYGDFGVNDPVTREQVAAVMYQYAQNVGQDVSVGEDTNILSYDDALEIAEYAIPAMQWAVGAGIINGDGAALNPKGVATRAQVAVMLYRWLADDRTSTPDVGEGIKFKYHFADREEGISLIRGHTEYYNNFSQNDIDYRAQKKGATLEEVMEFAADQVSEYSEEEKLLIDDAIHYIESILNKNGYVLPQMEEIVFVKTTTLEESGADGYTHNTEIYFGDIFLDYLRSDDEAAQRYGLSTICHEIFHCLTRNNPQFRKDIYSIIHFNIADADCEVGPEIREMIFSNPDVDRHDAYITLTVNGEKKDCVMYAIVTEPFEEEGDMFVNALDVILVPLDDTNTYYRRGVDIDGEEFYSLVGRNTGYILDPEECMADNFGDAIIYGRDGKNGEPYKSPEIIDQILDYLKK